MSRLSLDSTTNLQSTNRYKLVIVTMIYRLFLLTTAFMPFASLFWNTKIFGVKANWAPYPLFLLGVFLILFRKRIPFEFVGLICFTGFYWVLAYLRGGEIETIVRFAIAIMPLTFYSLFDEMMNTRYRFFWWIYGALMLIPIYNSYMQYIGKMPFDEYDIINGEVFGRMSGGYQKPMNLVAYGVPILLSGFYLWKVKEQRITGITIVMVTLIGVYLTGHRTSLIAYLVIFVSSFFMRFTRKVLYAYYRYFLNFFIPLFAFMFFRLMLSTVGLWDKIRGRLPIWELHAWQFFDQNVFNIIFGSQKVIIQEAYRDPSVYLLEEVHNNSFRTIIVFGIAGFFLYCVFMRKIVMQIKKNNYAFEFEFVILSCFTYFLLYSITNEPLYYGSVLWPILIWIFLAQSMPLHRKTSSNFN